MRTDSQTARTRASIWVIVRRVVQRVNRGSSGRLGATTFSDGGLTQARTADVHCFICDSSIVGSVLCWAAMNFTILQGHALLNAGRQLAPFLMVDSAWRAIALPAPAWAIASRAERSVPQRCESTFSVLQAW